MKKGIALLLALILCLGCALAETDLSKYVSNPDEKITIAWLAGHDTDAIAEGDTVVDVSDINAVVNIVLGKTE